MCLFWGLLSKSLSKTGNSLRQPTRPPTSCYVTLRLNNPTTSAVFPKAGARGNGEISPSITSAGSNRAAWVWPLLTIRLWMWAGAPHLTENQESNRRFGSAGRTWRAAADRRLSNNRLPQRDQTRLLVNLNIFFNVSWISEADTDCKASTEVVWRPLKPA